MIDFLLSNIPPVTDRLSEAACAALFHAGILRDYADGQLVHSRGDAKPGLTVVRSGAVQAGMYDGDGRFILAAVLGVGQIFGEFTLFTALPRTHDIIASGPTCLCQIPAVNFHHVCDTHPEILRVLLEISLLRNHLLLETLDTVRRLPMREQTARILLTLSRTASDPRHIVIKQSDVAQALGVSRLTAIKALKALKAEALIETGYGAIRIPNPERLAQWVETHCDPTPLLS